MSGTTSGGDWLVWRPIDAVADWLRHRLGARAQLRAGILTVLVSTLWTVAALLHGSEPPNVLAMSGVALILTGIGIVVGAQVLEQGENDAPTNRPAEPDTSTQAEP